MAAAPNFTKHLNNDDFNEFKELVELCYDHVIGDPVTTDTHSPRSPGDRPSSGTTVGRSFSRSNSRSRPTSPVSTGRRTPARMASSEAVPIDRNKNQPETPTGSLQKESDSMARIQMPPPNSPYVYVLD